LPYLLDFLLVSSFISLSIGQIFVESGKNSPASQLSGLLGRWGLWQLPELAKKQ